MKALEFTSLVTAGALSPPAQQQFEQALKKLEGRQVVVSVAEKRKKRTLDQNAWYWGGVIPPVLAMFREHGNYVDAEDVHEFLKLRVGKLAQVFVTPHGEVLKGPGSTAKLTTAEFSDFIERVRAWAADFGCVIPSPDEHLDQPPGDPT